MASTLSVILIARNESLNIGECLESVAFANEIIVVDGGSTDDTVAIAQKHGARVVIAPDWPGFGAQKNRALELATQEWVLSIDADERVTPELAAEILAQLQKNDAEAFELPRRSWFCGQWIRHSGWWPDPVLRLFRRGCARFSDDLVHERLVVNANVACERLQHPLLHYSYRNFSQVLQKIDSYSSAGARMRHQTGKRTSMASAIGHGVWAFVRTYFLRRGFLDGRSGVLIALMNAEVSFYKYVKLAQSNCKVSSTQEDL